MVAKIIFYQYDQYTYHISTNIPPDKILGGLKQTCKDTRKIHKTHSGAAAKTNIKNIKPKNPLEQTLGG